MANNSIVALVALVVIIVIVASLGAFQIAEKELSARINAKIYSATNNIGILNEIGSFNIHINNNSNSTQNVKVTIETASDTLINTTMSVEAKSAKDGTYSQKLTDSGTWIIKVASSDQKILDSYSFVTLANSIDADIEINQLNNIQKNTDISTQANILAFSSLCVSAAALVISIRKSKVK